MAAVLGEEELRRSIGLRRFADLLWMEQHKPDDPNPESGEDILKRIIRAELRRPTVQVSSYREGGGGGSSWEKWIIPGLVTLMVMGIGGAVAMFGKLSSLEARVESVQNQVNDVKRIVEPRYRGAQ